MAPIAFTIILPSSNQVYYKLLHTAWIFTWAICNVRLELWLQRIDLYQRNIFCKILPKEGIFWPKRTTEAVLLGWLVKQRLFLFTFALRKLPFHSEKKHDMIIGQLISKCPYEKSVLSKIPTKNFRDFCPSF